MLGIRQALNKSGLRAKPLALRMGTTGNGDIQHVNRYKSTSPSVIAAECEIALEAGFVGFVQMWNGPKDTFLHESMLGLWEECSQRGLLMAVMMDKWVAANEPILSRNSAVETALNDPDFQKVLHSAAYLPEKYILEFNIGAVGVDTKVIQAAFPSNPILSEGTGYTWPNAESPNPVSVLKAQNASPMLRIGGLCLHFYDGGFPLPGGVNQAASNYTGARDWNRSVWGPQAPAVAPTRVIESQGGNYYHDQLGVTPVPLKYVMYATWDDFDEGTAILHFLSMMSGIRVA